MFRKFGNFLFSSSEPISGVNSRSTLAITSRSAICGFFWGVCFRVVFDNFCCWCSCCCDFGGFRWLALLVGQK